MRLIERIHRFLIGRPKDPTAPGAIHQLQLIAFFAWVGLGADGLSSACYGPEEAYLELGEHHFLALPLALLIIVTIAVISASYSQIIKLFPAGGGGYLVATRLLGKWPGVVSGCALVVDYILTVTISISSCVDQVFSLLPPSFQSAKLVVAVFLLAILTILNLRGVKESILFLLPIFLAFLVTHAVLIVGGFFRHSDRVGDLWSGFTAEAVRDSSSIGIWATLAILLHAYTRGAGTFTGLEAISNSMQILREPRAKTGRRTMVYMAISLAIAASGILIGYVLVDVRPEQGKTLNAVLFAAVSEGWPAGKLLLAVALIAEGALLFVAAQAGFIGGPRSLATMAVDGWVPKRFAHLSNRLVVADGVILMSVAALIFLIATRGDVKLLIILYSINVFITFALSQLGMCTHWLKERKAGGKWSRGLIIATSGFAMSVFILVMMVATKFTSGGWVTLVVTAGLVGLCVLCHGHYRRVGLMLRKVDRRMFAIEAPSPRPVVEKDPMAPTAVVLVSGFNGLGLHALYTIHRLFPDRYRNFVLVSVGHVDYDRFQNEEEIAHLRSETHAKLEQYEPYVRAFGAGFDIRVRVSADVTDELESICQEIRSEYPRAVVYGGQLILEPEYPWTRMLHGYVTYELQRRLHHHGIAMMILPTTV